MAATVTQQFMPVARQRHDRMALSQAQAPAVAHDSSSEEEAGPEAIGHEWSDVQVEEPESVVGVSISRAQTWLASPTTPAVEKEDAIQRGGGYFSLDGMIAEVASESPSSDTFEDTIAGPETPNRQVHELDANDRLFNEAPLVQEPLLIRRSNSVSTTGGSIKDPRYQYLQSRPGASTVRRTTSDNSLNLRKALSTASSLGDDNRFENVKDQVNSRLKALKDSFQDSSFRLPHVPSLPKFPNIIAAVSKTSLKDDESALRQTDSNSSATARDSVLTALRKRALSKPKSMSSSGDNVSSGATLNSAFDSAHPNFNKALRELTGDLIVMGGYRGSILRSSQYPHHRVWVPIKAGFNLKQVDLEVGLTDQDEEEMVNSIFPDGMLSHIGPVDISRRLLKKLFACKSVESGKLRVHNYGYDWRLSPTRLSQQLVAFAEKLPCNQRDHPESERGAWIIAHSLGGLITRHAINQRPDLFRGVVYAGTPTRCVNILGPFRNGDDVLFNSKILTAQVNFTIRTSFALLPLDGKCFVDEDTKEELPVDFFDPNDWIKYEWSPCVVPTRAQKPAKRGTIESISEMMSKSFGDVLDDIQSIGRRSSPKSRKASNGELVDQDSNNTTANEVTGETGVAPQMSSNMREGRAAAESQPKSATTTIPHAVAVEYLQRTLASIKKFKQELDAIPGHTASNSYPPAAVIYGKTTPTVSAARVKGYEGISRSDAYDNLVFGSGDGVVLARAAMLPDHYKAAKGGVIGSDRGHVTLLGDLEAIGRSLVAVMRARSHGVGSGALKVPTESEFERA